MAQDFERKIARNISTSDNTTDLLGGASNSDDAVVGIRFANTHATDAVTVDCYLRVSSTNYYLVKGAPIPQGGSLELIDGGSKIVMQSGDQLYATAGTANSVDSVVSLVDAIST
jgi:hypothetical protein|tara:strand:+ start:462 stop:803 length:342 start_codon:yes stop_codon:yes gene_type:complete